MKGLLILQLLAVLAYNVAGDFEIEIAFESYSNPTGRCFECFGATPTVPACCDSISPIPQNQSCPASTACETVVRFCRRPVGSRELCQRSQEVGLNGPQGVMSERSFNITSSFFGILNPVPIFGRGGWDGLQILFIFRECSFNFNLGPVCDDLVDSIPIDIDIEIGTCISRSVFSGAANISKVVVSSIEVRCAEGFYGPDCFTQCSDFVSCASCGLSGFTGQFCQFSIDECSDVFCNGNGNCREGSDICDCDIDFTGERCETNIDNCAGAECSNGECVDEINGFRCECEPGFAGTLCQDASTATAGVVAGSVVGALIAATLIVVTVVVIILLTIKRSRKLAYVEGTSNTLPGDNPSYDTRPGLNLTMPGDNPSYGTGAEFNKYQEIPAQNGTSNLRDHNSQQLSSRDSPDREFDNPIYGGDDITGQEAESENVYTMPDSPSHDNITSQEEVPENLYASPDSPSHSNS